jgi:hypothetical protein
MKPNVRRLKAILESDPGGLVRVLHLFQARNVTPVRVAADRIGPELLNVEIDVSADDLAVEAMQLVAAKVRELTVAVCAVVCD